MKFAGWVDYNRDLREYSDVISAMESALEGEESGIYIQKEAALFHKKNIDNVYFPPLTLTYNGETYAQLFSGKVSNFNELKNEICCQGFNINSGCAETALAAYILWGDVAFSRLRGSFAVAIWKENAKSLFMARGAKDSDPLFYCPYEEGMLFACQKDPLLKNPFAKEDAIKKLNTNSFINYNKKGLS
jgi:asparagine synthase (glutamine-hydrolysing)